MPHVVDEMLEVIRVHLGMDVAFVSSIESGQRVFRHVAAGAGHDAVRVGGSHPLETTYCTRIIAGGTGLLTPDAMADAGLRDLPVTAELGIRAYAGVPIRTPAGDVYGTLCAFSSDRHDFGANDIHALELAATLIAHRLQGEAHLSAADPDRNLVLSEQVRGGQALRMVFQPIVELRGGEVRGYEALARFDTEKVRAPEDWFALARRLGFDTILQRQAVQRALCDIDRIPSSCFLALNLSEDALLDPGVRDLLLDQAGDRLVLEVTEHEARREDLPRVQDALALLRAEGIRIAMDDVGAGYAGVARVLSLEPEFIKLDRSLVVGVWERSSLQAMVQAFTTFARAVGAGVIAEGIEDQADADALRILGVTLGQGFLLGRPDEAPNPA